MSDLRRRIPPKPFRALVNELLDNPDISHYDACLLAKERYDQEMEEIYRLARIGETAEAEIARLQKSLDDMHLAYVQASNPGIDADEVRRVRGH